MLLAVGLSGCWDSETIQDINYITALGIDYEDGNYVVYTQSMDFARLAKQESPKSSSEGSVLVGKAVGNTLELAITSLHRASQMRIIFQHLTAIVLTERAFQADMHHILDAICRYYEIRYRSWVYGTREPMKELFSLRNPFNGSQRLSLLHEPKEPYKQRSMIPPIQLVQFTKQLREPDQTLLLPSLKINQSNWSQGEQSVRQFEISGIYALKNDKYKGWFSVSDMIGMRWMTPQTEATPLAIEEDGKEVGYLSMHEPKVKTSFRMADGRPSFRIHVKVKGELQEELTAISEKEIKQKAQEKIRQEIYETYRKGMKKQTDVYSVAHLWYRSDNHSWKQMKPQEREEAIRNLKVEDITVDVSLTHTGMTKLRTP
ncbi:Ger(x)C family spore germination protein [Paenibacillus larvae]|uniref:Ger(x)C family spore germination protein n=1 Tax=Paenibacillus larvae TaxID=1464 RepID=UPI002DBB2952|nr:Ger(x)C family spore germination protein [Paenibacillus larvae]MEC0187624.1 Ger(x)C family spore germination protein [Paenibacillus larvae]